MLNKGAILRFPIRDSQGLLLVSQGATVTDRLRALLETRGITVEIHACLKLVEGEKAGLEMPINKSLFKIGRRPDCDLQLASPVVSGYHCQIRKRAEGVFLEDLESNNGTFQNQKRLTEIAELNDNDNIRIGHFVFSVQIYAALAADPGNGAKVLNAWILEEKNPRKRPATPYCPTEADIDLDNFSFPKLGN
jgi:pSer/pThr/pTyr-binding forkhead associated (FHA) protein